MPNRAHKVRRIVALFVVGFLVGCGGEEIATERESTIDVSPAAIASLPEDIEEASVTVANGMFGVDVIRLLEGVPTVLHVTNEDDRAYRLQIVEDLVTAAPIASNATTDIEFTTPNAGEFEGQLLPDEGDDVLDTVQVIVRSAGGVQP